MNLFLRDFPAISSILKTYHRFVIAAALIAAVASAAPGMIAQTTSSPLILSKTIALAGVSGKFDHFAIDVAGDRLFAAATGNHSVEVIDLKSGKVAESIGGLGKPHGLAWVDATGSLYVADGSLAELRVYQGTPLKLAGTIKLSDDADDMVFDEAHHLLYVGHGGASAAAPGKVAIVDTATFTAGGESRLCRASGGAGSGCGGAADLCQHCRCRGSGRDRRRQGDDCGALEAEQGQR